MALPPPLPQQPTPPADVDATAIRERYRRWITGKLAPPPRSWLLVAIGIVLLLTGVLAIVGVVLIYKGLRRSDPYAARLQAELAFAARAEPVMAFPLMVNTMLRRPGDQAAPGLFLVCFDRDRGGHLQFMTDCVLAIEMTEPHKYPPADVAWATALMADEEYQRGRRRRLPDSITGGVAVYACDVALHPHYLPDRHVSDEIPMVPCLAEPGDHGEVRPIPYWTAFDVPPPPWEPATPVFAA